MPRRRFLSPAAVAPACFLFGLAAGALLPRPEPPPLPPPEPVPVLELAAGPDGKLYFRPTAAAPNTWCETYADFEGKLSWELRSLRLRPHAVAYSDGSVKIPD